MSKQIYIDSEGNEIQVSGTVNSADMLPLEAGSSKMTSEAIGPLSDLTTTNKDSLVDAVNEVDNRKLAMSSSVNRGTIQISGSNNRMVITIYADANNGMRMDFRGDNNVIRLATTSDGGTNWTNTNEIAFTHI